MTEKVKFNQDERERIAYMQDAIASFLLRSGIPPRLYGPAVFMVSVEMYARSENDHEALIEEFKTFLSIARQKIAELEKADGATIQ